jgi:hypothetical protein
MTFECMKGSLPHQNFLTPMVVITPVSGLI